MAVSTPSALLSFSNDEGAADPYTTASFSVVGGTDNMIVLDLAQAFGGAALTSAPTMSGGVGSSTVIAEEFRAANYAVGAWRWLNVAAGSYTISIAGHTGSISLRVLEMTGVDQTTPISGAVSANNDDGGGPENTITSATDDRVIAAIYTTADPTPTQTQVGENNFRYSGGWHNTEQAAGAASVVMDWTGEAAEWASLAYNVNAAAVGGPLTPGSIIATPGDGEVVISEGTAPSDGDGPPYTTSIYRSTTNGVKGALLQASATLPYTDTTAANGTTYYYTGEIGDGTTTEDTAQVSATPEAPATVPGSIIESGLIRSPLLHSRLVR